jgi:hypothetical protein
MILDVVLGHELPCYNAQFVLKNFNSKNVIKILHIFPNQVKVFYFDDFQSLLLIPMFKEGAILLNQSGCIWNFSFQKKRAMHLRQQNRSQE